MPYDQDLTEFVQFGVLKATSLRVRHGDKLEMFKDAVLLRRQAIPVDQLYWPCLRIPRPRQPRYDGAEKC